LHPTANRRSCKTAPTEYGNRQEFHPRLVMRAGLRDFFPVAFFKGTVGALSIRFTASSKACRDSTYLSGLAQV